jgi:NitT/TauT family transport system permease protein
MQRADGKAMKQVAPSKEHEKRTRTVWPGIRDSAATIGVFVALLLIWEGCVRLFHIQSFILPAPSAVAVGLIQAVSDLTTIESIGNTMASTVMGFIVGALTGMILAPLIFSSKLCARTLYPILVAIQTIPKVTLAPLMLAWFGLGLAPKLILIGVITFFPVLANVLAGLGSVDQKRLDLFRMLHASRWQTLMKLQYPAALPYLFAALEVAAIYSLVGAIVVEFVGSQGGIGTILMQRNYDLDIPSVFALIAILSTLGMVLHWIVRAIERHVVFWSGGRKEADNVI